LDMGAAILGHYPFTPLQCQIFCSLRIAYDAASMHPNLR